MNTIAEDYVLLVIDPDTGSPLVNKMRFLTFPATALAIDLALGDRLTKSPTPSARAGKKNDDGLYELDRAETGDALIDWATGRLPRQSPIAGKDVIEALRRQTTDRVLAGLVTAGVFEAGTTRRFGLLERKVWTTRDPSLRREVIDELDTVLVKGEAPTDRQSALIGLLSMTFAASGKFSRILPGHDGSTRARAKQILAAKRWDSVCITPLLTAGGDVAMTAVSRRG